MRFRSHNGRLRIGRSASLSVSSGINKQPLPRSSKALTEMWTWISCHRSLRASWVLYAGSINMTNAVDSLNVENIVEGSRCATALASHAGIPVPLVLRFEECGGSLPPGGSLWPKSIKGEAVHDQRSTRAEAPSRIQPTHEVLPRADPRSFVSAPETLCRDHTQEPWVLRSARGDSSALLPIPIVACCSPPMERRSCIRRC